ncbi:50S ribosomal protein L35ae [Candidatus Woesearchaeota archaeon CG11_big_fil_rev_8_21_14_0_20_43_8]|nr:MAG: 50S ribosomal protein L35ae [Candidatus Woesearchaeota archaeon CG11_big_fil_rev_8_21_14_0_20_43_8]PIO04658.1 MAG: 50S ribosomal protein L35ae [Candidatus Woesearchaeota archaeon CG08_land_8_20_14_0_20_43_7]
MQGSVVNFRRGRHTQRTNHLVILPDGCKTKEEAKKLVGKSVKWTSPAKKELAGKVIAVHGGNGAVRVEFETGIPGQALGTKVTIN